MTSYPDLFEIDALNPLLRHLPAERNLKQWADDLKYDPRDTWKRPFVRVPESHVHTIEASFVPIMLSVVVAASLYTMLIVSLRQRDPRLAANRRRIFEFAELKRGKLGPDLCDLPWFSGGASGSILRGPTGCTKTHTLRALFRRLPQLVVHGEEQECGWLSLKQLVYLHVDMDATRGGLVRNIAMAMDDALRTSYAEGLRKLRTVEEKLVEILHLLMIHRCGVLVLDEVQVRNVAPVRLGPEFVAFFLRLMNCGIPLVLVGNPLSFDHVLGFSQDLRRLTHTGIFDFYPCYDELDEEWVSQLVPGVWRWTVFNKPDPVIPNLARLLYERTGGIADFLVLYRRESIVQALRAGAECVTRKHMDAAFDSHAMRELHGLISGYVKKDIQKISQFSDQPIGFLETFWRRTKSMRLAQDKLSKHEAVLAPS